MVPACLLALIVFLVGIATNRYDALLSREGFGFGTLSGRRLIKWSQIRSVYVIRAITGKEVCLELECEASSHVPGKHVLKRLPETYGMDAEELAKTLLRWQREYGTTRGS